jgi:ABC-type polysaccharide/polyol phosphate export permease
MIDGALVLHRYVARQHEPFGRDLYQGTLAWPLWTMLGWNDIRQRYRRSMLGPIWITLSMAIFIAVLSMIYSRIFQVDINVYVPYVSLGLITWNFLSASVNESCVAFQESDRIVKQVRIPYSVFVLRVVWRNFIVLLHTITLYIPIALIFSIKPSFTTFLVLPGLVLLIMNQVWLGIVLAIISTRYRDVPQLVITALQIGMFATPIMWPVSSLSGGLWIAEVNPAYHLIELVRAPLLGEIPSGLSWTVAVACCVLGTLVAMLLLRRASHRLIYWL